MISKIEMRRIVEQCVDDDGSFMFKIMKKIRDMTPEEFKQSLVNAGIITEGEKLTSAYRNGERETVFRIDDKIMIENYELIKDLNG